MHPDHPTKPKTLIETFIVGEMGLEGMLTNLFENNPYFTAGFGLLGVGAGLASIRQGIVRLVYFAQRRYLTTVEVTSKDPSYRWITQWLSKQALTSGNHYSLNATFARSASPNPSDMVVGVRFSPAPGVHYFKWRHNWIKVSREREKTALMDLQSGIPFETITMTTIGRRPELFMRLIDEARGLAAREEEGKLVIYTSWANEWRPFGNARRKRPLDSVIFADGVKEALVADVKEFMQSSKWYADRGIPYRRGYLLHGPPGGGKSSFVQALASELDYGICLLNLSEHMITNDRLNHLLNALPERTILLLEDVDGAMHTPIALDAPKPTTAHAGMGSRLTFSGLLNALDGVASSEERIIFMTTNHYDRLDPALIRPGRIDYQQYIGLADREQITAMFRRFYPEATRSTADQFADVVLSWNPSPAAIQGHFIQYKTSFADALANAPLLEAPVECNDKETNKS